VLPGVADVYSKWIVTVLRLAQLSTLSFQDGGNKPEVVLCSILLCQILSSVNELNSPSLVQRGSIKNVMSDNMRYNYQLNETKTRFHFQLILC